MSRLLPPVGVRRYLVAPLWCVASVAIALLAIPFVLLASLVIPMLPARWRPGVRVFVVGVAFLATYECGALLSCVALWLASGFGRGIATVRYRHAHDAVNRGLLAATFRAGLPLARLKLAVVADLPGELRADRPLLVLARHVGSFNGPFVIHLVYALLRRQPRIILKRAVAFDPALDVMLHRLPNRFIQPGGRGRSAALAAIEDLCGSAGPGDAIVLFPEGTSFTAARHARAIDCLRRNGLSWQAARAGGLRHVLPPRLAGTQAALAAAPGADVVFLAHTGVAAVPSLDPRTWTDGACRETLAVRCWRVPAEAVPRGPDEQARWLYDWWETIDIWIGSGHGDRTPWPDAPAGPGGPDVAGVGVHGAALRSG